MEPSHDVLDFLLARRSSKPALLEGAGPSAGELEKILTAAARVPDHKKLVPWRFLVFEGEARAQFGELIANIIAREADEPVTDVRLETERTRFLRAPLVIGVIYSPRKTEVVPEREQILSCGAACMNLCVAANALGFATSWITEWYSYDPFVDHALGLRDKEQVAGFIYIGRASSPQPDRDRPNLGDIVEKWSMKESPGK